MRAHKLEILGHTYWIVPKENLQQDEGTRAQVNFRTSEIFYDPSFSYTFVEEAIFHEMLEAFNLHMGFKLDHGVITALSELFYDTLRRNGLLMPVLTTKEDEEVGRYLLEKMGPFRHKEAGDASRV